jgi:hypothetical protein
MVIVHDYPLAAIYPYSRGPCVASSTRSALCGHPIVKIACAVDATWPVAPVAPVATVATVAPAVMVVTVV